MPLWCKGRPQGLADQVVVFLDADNALIQEGRPYNPAHNVGTVLQNVVAFARTIAHRWEITAFKNLFPNHSDERKRLNDEALIRELRTECARLDIALLHVERADGRDQVDGSIVGRWYQRQAMTNIELPFVLVSEDGGFKGIVHDARQEGRSVYLALPVNKFYPRHANDATGWGWLDEEANLYRAMYFMWAREAPAMTPEFRDGFIHYYPALRGWETAMQILVSDFLRSPHMRFEDEGYLAGTLEIMWHDIPSLPRDAHRIVVPYLVHYGIIVPRRSCEDDQVLVPGSWRHIMRLPPG